MFLFYISLMYVNHSAYSVFLVRKPGAKFGRGDLCDVLALFVYV